MDSIDRRRFVVSLAGLGAAVDRAAAQAAPPAPRFGYDEVVTRARDLSTAPVAPARPLPEPLARLDPSVAKEIKFRPEKEFFAATGSRFRLETIHLDPRSTRSVTVNLIREGIATPIPYAASLFDFGRAKFERALPLNLGFAGFRIKFPLDRPDLSEDAIVFTAAGQFELLGRGQRRGAMLRALSVNAADASEEFPFFREFWVQLPGPNSTRVTVFALLDGESATGAFSFQLTPGANSALDVTATLFPRRIGGKFGVAPLTSMYFSKGDRGPGQFPPSAHNSDGLMMRTGAGEWLWRPLRNPAKGDRFAFLDRNPRGFGLVQRDRAFDHYQDLNASYEARPNYWVEPFGDWGEGQVELSELAATSAAISNISASWVGNARIEPGKPFKFAYRISATLDERWASAVGRVIDMYQSPSAEPGGRGRRLRIDFAGGDLAWYLGDPARVEVLATANNGRVVSAIVEPNTHIKGFRATVDIEAPPDQASDVRVSLRSGGKSLSEIWTMPVDA